MVCSMLLNCVNMADVARGRGYTEETVVNGQWVWELRKGPERTVAGVVNL